MKDRTVYIAGPMRGMPYFNFPAFDSARDMLVKCGCKVLSPADLDRVAGIDVDSMPPDSDWNDVSAVGCSIHEIIERDLKALSMCDTIFMLEGWEESIGAQAEHALAKWRGMDIFYYDEESEEDVLDEAKRLTHGNRHESYGPPHVDLNRTAAMWSALFGVALTGRHVAMGMIAVKLSREVNRSKRDNAVDIAGYAWCLDECNRAEDEA